MPKLYPPNLEGTLPAFYGTTLVVPFSMNKAVAIGEVQSILIKIKTVQSNSFIYSGETKDFSLSTSYCEAQFNLNFDDENPIKLNIGQYYKVQIAYRSTDKPGTIGYYSTVGVIKYAAKPESIIIDGLSQELGKINLHQYIYIGRYKVNPNDREEKVYSYQFNLYDSTKKQIIQTSGEQIHNSYKDTEIGESYDEFNINSDLELNQIYYLEYKVKTINGLELSSGYYKLMQKQSIDPEIKVTLMPTLNFENGYISLALVGEKDEAGIEYSATGSYRIVRASAEDDFKTWNEILKFELFGQKPSKWLWKDFTIKQGVVYKYGLQQYNENITSNRVESEEIYADFEHAFLFDGKRQLKLKYNPKVASFKNNILEQKTNTIGGKYPFIFRNGNVKYKEFSISGLISCRSDEEFLFVNEDKYDWTINLTSNNIQTERDFKLEVLEWLNNGEPKVFRSPGEGNYIVRLVNVSMAPNDTVGRMLHTVTGTAIEIADWTYSGLEEYGFIQVEDLTTKQIRWETINLNNFDSDKNFLNYSAIALHFEGMIPGDKLLINNKEIIIGVTGSYAIGLSSGITVNSIKFLDSPDKDNQARGGVRHQGTLTYAYYSQEKTRFSSIESIQIQDIPLQQFIGEHDILAEIQNIKTQIREIYWLRATKREVHTIYRRNGQYYTSESTDSDIFTDFQPYMIYQVIDNDKESYYDTYQDKEYDNYEPYIIFNEVVIDGKQSKYIDLSEIYEYKVQDLEELKTLKIGNGIILDISYQQQNITYLVENKINTDNLKEILNVLNNNGKVNENKRAEYNAIYKAYIDEVTKLLESEEAIKGESFA